MKRAEVWNSRCTGHWWVNVHEGQVPHRHLHLGERPVGLDLRGPFSTHAKAFYVALAAVGLDRPAEHREAP